MLKLSSSLMLFMLITCCSGTRPATLGVRDGRLSPCPASPNCVSTQATDAAHRAEPIGYTTTRDQAKQRLLKILASMPRVQIVAVEDDYVHAEFTSRLFRFVDDVEFSFDDSAGLIHFRSASRLGYSDLGVNRKRMEEIRKLFAGQTD